MLELKDIIRYLHYYAFRFENNRFEHWELINEAWIVVHGLKHIEFASQGIRWAMISYRRRENQHRRHGSSTATVLPLETDAGINKLVIKMTAVPSRHTPEMDNLDTIGWLANNAQLSTDERILLDQRFGRYMTLQDIADGRHCTHQNVLQKMNRVITKLCRAARRLERRELSCTY